jgi:hypothetical protein
MGEIRPDRWLEKIASIALQLSARCPTSVSTARNKIPQMALAAVSPMES